MSTSILTPARAAYYDRNATSSILYDATTYAPHSPTVRWTTTVAAGTKLLVEMANASVTVQTVATTANTVNSFVRVTSGGQISDLAMAACIGTSTQYLAFVVNNPANTTIYAGETVQGYSYNASTDGTVLHYTGYKGTLYTA